MYQEKTEEEDLPALKTVLTHRYDDSKTTLLASPLPPSFLDTYSLSTSSLGCNALCMVISFLMLWAICLRSSLVAYHVTGTLLEVEQGRT